MEYEYIKRLLLYIETSVFGFYYDEKLKIGVSRKPLHCFFNQIRRDFFKAFYSDIPLAEIERTEDDVKKQKLLDLIPDFGLQKIEMPPYEDELNLLSKTFLEKQIIP